MKILQISAAYKPAYVYGGPTMSVAALTEALTRAGHTVEVYTTTANGEAELPCSYEPVIVDGVPVRYFKRITGDHSHFSPALLRHLWQHAKDFEVIHIHAWWNLVSVLGAFTAVWRKVPVVVSPRGTLSYYTFRHRNSLPKRLFHRLFTRPVLKRCFLHATSVMEQKQLQNIVKPRGLNVVPNFVKLATQAKSEKSYTGGPLRLLYFSRIDPKKNPAALIRSLRHTSIPVSLTFAGNGNASYLEELKSLSIAEGIAPLISWIGFRGDDKFEVLADHDILVLPSEDENFANVVIESLSIGTAVIVSKNVGLSTYVHQNGLGLICDTDEFSIAQNIDQLGSQPQQLADIAVNGPKIIRRDFDDRLLVKQYIDLYQETIDLYR